MKAKFSVGQVVRTIKGCYMKTEGPIYEIIEPSSDLKLLWGADELHYLIKDNQTQEFFSVIERVLEKS